LPFFENGIEPLPATQAGSYSFQGAEPVIIKGRKRIIDGLVTPEMFHNRLKVLFGGEPQNREALEKVRSFIEKYRSDGKPRTAERIAVPLPVFFCESLPQ